MNELTFEKLTQLVKTVLANTSTRAREHSPRKYDGIKVTRGQICSTSDASHIHRIWTQRAKSDKTWHTLATLLGSWVSLAALHSCSNIQYLRRARAASAALVVLPHEPNLNFSPTLH